MSDNQQKHCGFCYDCEQGTHGEVKREWSTEWSMYIPVCRKHTLCDGMEAKELANKQDDEKEEL